MRFFGGLTGRYTRVVKHISLDVCLVAFALLSRSLHAQNSLASQEIKNVDATADVTVNATLPPAPLTYRLSGTISGPAPAFLAVTAQSPDGMSVFSARVDPLTHTYVVMVPAGSYKLSVDYIASFSDATGGATFQDPLPVEVNADIVRDIAVAPAVTHRVSGTISALDPRFASAVLIFAPTDPTGGSVPSMPKINADGTYAAQLSDGAYSPLVLFSTPDASRTTTVVLGSLTVSGADVSADFAVPALANLSGTVRMADMSPLPAFSTIVSIEANRLRLRNPNAVSLAMFGAVSIDSDSGAYQLVLASGQTYTLALYLPQVLQQSIGAFVFLIPSAQLSGDTIQDITVPQIPGTVTITGQVTDSTGAPVGNARVDASTAAVTGIPMSSFFRTTQTDTTGNYSLVVLSGTNYDLVFNPPILSSPSLRESGKRMPLSRLP